MKKILLLLTVLLSINLIVHAQDFATKGDIEVGGNISFTSITSVHNGETASNSTSIFSFSPYFGYFVVNNLELGIIPSFTSYSYGGGSSITTFGIYFAPAWNFDLKSHTYPFIEGQIGYNSQSNGATEGGLAWAVKGGIKAQVGSSALINFGIYYTQVTMNPDGADKRNGYNQFGISGGFTIFFNK